MVTAHPILVVEDEFLIALDIVAALEQAGIAVAGPASTVQDALGAIEGQQLGGVLLDAHLEETDMLLWAIIFAVVALVAGIFGFGGVASAAAGLARILFFIFVIVFLVTLIAAIV